MVHALKEIHRILKPGGFLIDLRPLQAHWPVEIASAGISTEVAQLIDLPDAVQDDQAAGGAMKEAGRLGLFRKEREQTFPYFYYWDTPSEMEKFIKTEWEGVANLGDREIRDVKSAWVRANADAQVRIRVKMHIAKWDKWWN